MTDTPPTADDVTDAANTAASSAMGDPYGLHDEIALPTAVAVLRTLARDGDTWESDQLVALADEIEQPATSGGGILCRDTHGGQIPHPHYHPPTFWDSDTTGGTDD